MSAGCQPSTGCCRNLLSIRCDVTLTGPTGSNTIYDKSCLNLTDGEVAKRVVGLLLSNFPRRSIFSSCAPWSRSNSTPSYFMAALPYDLRRQGRECCLVTQPHPPESGMPTMLAVGGCTVGLEVSVRTHPSLCFRFASSILMAGRNVIRMNMPGGVNFLFCVPRPLTRCRQIQFRSNDGRQS